MDTPSIRVAGLARYSWVGFLRVPPTLARVEPVHSEPAHSLAVIHLTGSLGCRLTGSSWGPREVRPQDEAVNQLNGRLTSRATPACWPSLRFQSDSSVASLSSTLRSFDQRCLKVSKALLRQSASA